MRSRQTGQSQDVAAAKSGVSVRSGRRIERGERIHAPRTWRTREDPLDAVWETHLAPLLAQAPDLTGLTLLEYLEDTFPGEYDGRVLRTLQRRVQHWKAVHGPDKAVIFRQQAEPGHQGLSDFTHVALAITIAGQAFVHLLYQFRLAFSGWRHAQVVQGGESYAALSEGLQAALRRLGGCPEEHRTDSLSAAFDNRTGAPRTRYEALCRHYGMTATHNNPGLDTTVACRVVASEPVTHGHKALLTTPFFNLLFHRCTVNSNTLMYAAVLALSALVTASCAEQSAEIATISDYRSRSAVEASTKVEYNDEDSSVNLDLSSRRFDWDKLQRQPGDPALGPDSAEVALLVFSDYACEYSRDMAPIILAFAEENPDLQIIYKLLPLLGDSSDNAARASIAAARQDGWREFHTRLMDSRPGINVDEAIRQAAEGAGLDVEQLERDMAIPELSTITKDNSVLAKELDLTGTPGFVIRNALAGVDHAVSGVVSREYLKAWLELERDVVGAYTYLLRGNERYNMGDFEQAIKDYDEALRRDPDNVSVYVNRGDARYNMNDYEKALLDYEETLRLDSSDPWAQNRLAWVLATGPNHLRDGQRAVDLARQALSMEDDPDIRDTLAAALAEVGEYEAAILEYEAVILEDSLLLQDYQKILKGMGYDSVKINNMYDAATSGALHACVRAGCQLVIPK